MTDLEQVVINWMYAVQERDSLLFDKASQCLAMMLDDLELSLLFTILGGEIHEDEKHWVKENLYPVA